MLLLKYLRNFLILCIVVEIYLYNFLNLSQICNVKNQFTFLSPVSLTALELSAKLLPGIERVELFTKSEQGIDFKLFTLVDGEMSGSNLSKKNQADFESIARQTKNMAWFSLSELPQNTQPNISSGNLFDELQKSVLAIKIQNTPSGTADLFLFYFRSNASEFGPILSDNVLDTGHKIFAGRLIYNNIKALFEQLVDNQFALVNYNLQISNMLKIHKQQLDEKDRMITQYQHQLRRIIESAISGYSSHSLQFSPYVITYLTENFVDIEHLQKQIEGAVNFAKTLSFGSGDLVLNIDIHHFIDYHNNTELKPEAKIADELDSYDAQTKVYQFLEILEKAAIKLLAKGEKLTSVNIGSIMDHPVTAAAISDKLKNHSRKVVSLLNQYPEKWSTIRNHFKPISNIQERVADAKIAS